MCLCVCTWSIGSSLLGVEFWSKRCTRLQLSLGELGQVGHDWMFVHIGVDDFFRGYHLRNQTKNFFLNERAAVPLVSIYSYEREENIQLCSLQHLVSWHGNDYPQIFFFKSTELWFRDQSHIPNSTSPQKKYLRQTHMQPGIQTHSLSGFTTHKDSRGRDWASFLAEAAQKTETAATTEPTVSTLCCASCQHCANHTNTTLSDTHQGDSTQELTHCY